jgi:phenylpropionate dioxygenase-like ring-hydroxylating dioxygenase large terminal subunit
MNAENNIKFHTLNDLTASQIDAIRSIPAHDQVEFPAIRATRPTSMFTDEAYFRKERERIFRRLPVAITPSAMIVEPGSIMAHHGYGLPLLVSRDRHGIARVFLNVCMHKGATLLHECTPQKRGRVTCPYHAWTWALDGNLIGAARAETFADLDKQQRNLVELPSREAGGLIWAILDRKAPADFSNLNDEVIADLDALQLGQQYVYGRKTFELNGNWKQVIEPFLEGYHVQRLHSQSVGPLFADVPTVVTRLGNHLRQTSGKVQFKPADLETEGARNIHRIVTHAYLLFPNTVIVTSPYYMSIMIIMPTAVGKTQVDYHMLTLNRADNPQAEQLYKTSYETVLNVFGNEDFAASETCYTGLNTGALDDIDVVYSGLERCIPMQYETLDKYMAD